ncbi:MAG: LuxR C-terminal-related transcriptional regulator [Anaerolineales bacterium]
MNRKESLQLTEHEIQVLRLVSQGLTNKEIAHSLGKKERTVEYHMGEIFQRLDVTSRTAAVVMAKNVGLLDI